MTPQRRTLRNGVALAASSLVHLLALWIFLAAGPNEYRLPEPPETTPPVEMEIERPAEITPPQTQPPIPRQSTPRPAVPTPPPPVPQPPPTPQPPRESPSPARPQPEPVKVQTQKPLTAAPSPAPVRLIRPTSAPSVSLLQAPQFTPAPAPPSPPAPATAPGPTAPHLNVHKAEKEAPLGALTLPFAPAATQPPPGGKPASAAGGGGPPSAGGGSRLEGLRPYPPGAFPSGGSGLRGSLVGCANAEAVGLSAVERARCASRFGEAPAGMPHLDPISPERRAVFDKEGDRAERDRAYRGHGSPTGWTTAPGGGPAGGMGSTMAPLPHSNPSGLPGSPAPQP